jgi:hypothetical protein
VGDKTVIALVIGTVVIVVVILLRGRLKSLGLKLFGHEVSASTHKPADPPAAGAHMTGVKAERGAAVRDETGNVATMTDVQTQGDASVTTTPPPQGASPSKKR